METYSERQADAEQWSAIVTAARAARDTRPPAGVVAAVGPALQASEYARDLWRWPSITDPRHDGAWLESGLYANIRRMAHNHVAWLTSRTGVFVLGSGRILEPGDTDY